MDRKVLAAIMIIVGLVQILVPFSFGGYATFWEAQDFIVKLYLTMLITGIVVIILGVLLYISVRKEKSY